MLALNPSHPRGHGNLQYYEQTLKKKGATYEMRGEDGLGDADETVNVLKVGHPSFILRQQWNRRGGR
jgi:hypothetical protein